MGIEVMGIEVMGIEVSGIGGAASPSGLEPTAPKKTTSRVEIVDLVSHRPFPRPPATFPHDMHHTARSLISSTSLFMGSQKNLEKLVGNLFTCSEIVIDI
jgi:hypothetical protein